MKVERIVKRQKLPDSTLENIVVKQHESFINTKIDRFPFMCYEARRDNKIEKDIHEAVGNPGGWSEKKDFKFSYTVPRELYLFMQNMVYRKFWADDNVKVRDSFMKAVLRGDDSHELLKKVKIYYGSTKSLEKTGEI